MVSGLYAFYRTLSQIQSDSGSAVCARSCTHVCSRVITGFCGRYHDNAKKVSRLMKDQPSTPADRIRFWVDYVVRHRGASHLHSDTARRLNWFQYWSLDVAVCLLAAVILIMFFSYRLLRLAFSVGSSVLNAFERRFNAYCNPVE